MSQSYSRWPQNGLNWIKIKKFSAPPRPPAVLNVHTQGPAYKKWPRAPKLENRHWNGVCNGILIYDVYRTTGQATLLYEQDAFYNVLAKCYDKDFNVGILSGRLGRVVYYV